MFQRRGAMRSATGRERSTPDAARPENDVPKSPWTTPVTQSKYRMYAGLSKPNSLRKAATVSSVAACPSTAWPKSPGSISIEEKIMIETTKSVAIPKTNR